VDASLRWLASRQSDASWLLVFDNADNIELNLRKYFPACSSGNILITTRNRELRHYTSKDADAEVKGMDLEDAKNMLLVQARVGFRRGSKTMSKIIHWRRQLYG